MNATELVARYLETRPGLSRRSIQKHRHNVNRWKRLVGEDLDCDRFRLAATSSGLRPRTIESTIRDMLTVARFVLPGPEVPVLGHPLRMVQSLPKVPTSGEIDRLYLSCHVAKWPILPNPGRWWQALIVTACWTGMRRSDLLRLRWSDIGPDWANTVGSKTGRPIRIPICEAVRRHLDSLQHPKTVFGHDTSGHQIYREMSRIRSAAEVPDIGMQALRRWSICAWSSANAEAGRIIHGSGLGILRHYVDPYRILCHAAEAVELPQSFTGPLAMEESQKVSGSESELLCNFRHANPENRRILLQIARCLSRAEATKKPPGRR